MGISLVPGQVNQNHSASATTNAVTLAKAPSIGNCVIATCIQSLNASTTMTCSDGTNTYTATPTTPVFDAPDGVFNLGIFYLPNVPSGAGATITVTFGTASTSSLYVSEWAGIATSSPVEIDGWGRVVGGATHNTMTVPGLPITTNGDLIIDQVCNTSASWTNQAPYTTLGTLGGVSFTNWSQYLIQTVAASAAPYWTSSNAGGVSIIAAFKPAVSNTIAPRALSRMEM